MHAVQDYLEVAACEQLKRQNVELQVNLQESSYRLKGSTTRVTAAPSKPSSQACI